MNKSVRILVVEDNQDHQAIIQLGLRKAIPGIVTMVADSETEVLAQLRQFEQDNSLIPRLILLDLYLPLKEDGLRVLSHIKAFSHEQKRPAIPVVVFSSSTEREDVNACYEQGVNAYVAKPLMFDQTMAFFQDLKTYWFETVTLPLG